MARVNGHDTYIWIANHTCCEYLRTAVFFTDVTHKTRVVHFACGAAGLYCIWGHKLQTANTNTQKT